MPNFPCIKDNPVSKLALLYASFVDDRNFEAMRTIITDEFSQRSAGWSCEGADAFIAQLDYLKQHYDATLHMVGNQLGNWSGDQYLGETYCVATHLYEKGGVGRKTEMGIRYRDDITKRGNSFYYASRDLRVVWTTDQPLLG